MSSRQPVHLQRLLHELEGVIDWRGLGIELKIPYAELKKIDQDCRGKTEECKRELLHRWLCRVADPTWNDVVEALRRMKLVNLAEMIKERCCHDSSELEPEISKAVVPLSRNAPVLSLPEVTPARIEEIHGQVEILQDKFLRLVRNLRRSLSERQSKSSNFLSDLQVAIYNIPASRRKPHLKFLADKQDEIAEAPSATKIVMILSLHWDYINTVFLEVIVKSLDIEEVKQELVDYLNELGPFSQSTKLCEFKSAYPATTIASPPGFLTVTIKIRGDWANYTLQKALQFGWQLSDECCLEGYTLLFVDSGYGSIRLVWAVPPSAVPILADALTPEFLERNNIEAIHVDGVELTALKKRLISTQEEDPPMKVCVHVNMTINHGHKVDHGSEFEIMQGKSNIVAIVHAVHASVPR